MERVYVFTRPAGTPAHLLIPRRIDQAAGDVAAAEDDAPRGEVDARRQRRGGHKDIEYAVAEGALDFLAFVVGQASVVVADAVQHSLSQRTTHAVWERFQLVTQEPSCFVTLLPNSLRSQPPVVRRPHRFAYLGL